jgi:hypothetical protein
MEKPLRSPVIDLGAVLIERDGDEIIVRSSKLHDLLVKVPRRTLEAWCLRKLRDEALSPEKNGTAV